MTVTMVPNLGFPRNVLLVSDFLLCRCSSGVAVHPGQALPNSQCIRLYLGKNKSVFFECGILEIQEFQQRVKGWCTRPHRMSVYLLKIKSEIPLREGTPICLHCKLFKYSSIYKRQMICRHIWIFMFHEFKEKKHSSLNRIAMAQTHQSFSNIWIQWSAFVQSTVARATQMCWQGFSQSAISRTASYNPPPSSPNPPAFRAL